MRSELDDVVLDEHALIASITRENLFEFVKEFWETITSEKPVWNWHIRYLCYELQKAAERVFRGEAKEHDLIINVCPGSTKSTIVSQMFPAWIWTRFPQGQIITGSYAAELAEKSCRLSREIFQSEKFRKCFPELVLTKDTEHLLTNTKHGWRLAVGTNGQVTGWHGHFILVDDPINPEQSFSQADLVRANRWITQTLSQRKVNSEVTLTVLIMQRLHQADPTGEWLDRVKDMEDPELKHICLPAELEHDEDGKPIGLKPERMAKYYKDGLFDPVRISRKVLAAKMKILGVYGFAGQMQQTPVPLGGGTFSLAKLELRDEAPKKWVRRVRAWDKAGTADGGNFSAGALLGEDKRGMWWIIHVIRGQWSASDREALILQTAQMDGKDVEIELEIEGGSGGKESAENTLKMLAGYIVRAVHPTGDKEARAYSFASQIGAGNVYCINADWTQDFLDELRFFPMGKYDDQVDASSAAFNRLTKKKIVLGALPIGPSKR